MPSATLQQFAEVSDSVAATTKKLQKQAILADYFRGLLEDDLRLAVQFSAGRAFGVTDERVLNVGTSLMADALLLVLDVDAIELRRLAVANGEIGQAMGAVWETRRRIPISDGGDPLTLGDLQKAFVEIAKLSRRENKRHALVELLVRVRTGREAAYVGKIIFGDLRTGVQEGVLQSAIALAFEATLQQVQRCQLLVGDLHEVAVLARRGEMSAASFKLFHPVHFMLAAPRETADEIIAAFDGRPFVAEDKLDGIRAQIHKSGEGVATRVAVYTRTLDGIEGSFPDVVAQISKLPGDFLLDGEIVPYADGVVLPFGQLQKRLGRKLPPAKVVREHPCSFIAFDLLYADGRLFMDEPLAVRRAALESLCGDVTPILPQTAVATADQVQAVFDGARQRRNEGLILKDPAGVYSPGRRGLLWFKLKTHLPTLDCVVTAAETGHGKRRNSLSDYTFAVWTGDPSVGGELVNIGKAYSGVTDEEIARLTELFTDITVSQHGSVRQVRPQVVMEIAFDQIQRSERHASGYALRFPRIKRIRWDKRPEDGERLERVAEIYESFSNFAKPTKESAVALAEPTLFD